MEDMLPALGAAYDDLARLVDSFGEREAWSPTGCLGWSVRDLVFHLLGDAQRALVALATPSDAAPDRDAVTYWVDAPSGDDPESSEVRAVRTMAGAYRLTALQTQYVETNRAVLTSARRSDPRARVATQGHTLLAADLFATLAVEAAVHHLDLVEHLDRPGPDAAPLAVVRRTLDGLLGRPAPVDWDDVRYAHVATGRRALSDAERVALGEDAARFPLLS